jgi:hypothetical protein
MSIAQRSTSVASITTASGDYYTVDRFRTLMTTAGTWTQSQSTDVPTGQGFATSLKMDCTTANGSLSANSRIVISQSIEAQNLQYLKKGTANAVSTTLSFWVKSTKTGTFIAELFDADNTRQISKSYTVDVTNTWEKKIITYEGDTTGTLNNDNGTGLSLFLWLSAGTDYSSGTLNTSWDSSTNANRAVGQVNIADDTSNDWYITGVQLEAGTTASDFEFLPVDVNKNRCLRYYYVHAEGNSKQIGLGGYYNSTYVTCALQFPQEMRVAPTLVKTTGTNYYGIYRDNTIDDFNDFNEGIQNPTTTSCGMDCSTNVSGTSGHVGRLITRNASSSISFNSEL